MSPLAPIRVALTTLGCKVNRADGEALLARLGDLVVEVPFGAKADLYVVNSCTVTATADRQSRQLIYRARRRNPGARVVLTGCYARVGPGEAARSAADRVFTLDQHGDLAEYVRSLQQSGSLTRPPESPAPTGELLVRARPFLKVQDGCNSRCTYCVVPRARGPSRSVPLLEAAARIDDLAAQGFEEVVLSGIHLGLYGVDLAPRATLMDLLHTCLHRVPRLRLSSIEPGEVCADLARLLADSPGICPHLHIPIQSADDEVLRAMNRPYRSTEVRDLLQDLHRRVPELALGADFMVGFPGETETQFQRTLAFVESTPLTHLHVFPFSPRPGTAAATLPGPVPHATARARARALREAGRRKQCAFAAEQVGELRDVLVEKRDASDLASGVTQSYLRTVVRLLPETPSPIGTLLSVRIEAAQGACLQARMLDR
jgi:threonylcarbamoyladenosine tRNA methylthiotransferase MtaB